MRSISLDGSWTLTRLATGETWPATVPGCVHTDLEAAGAIGRLHYRENETKLLWIGREDWAYAREFTLAADDLVFRAQVLICEGLDTVAEIELNGAPLGQTDNMFRRYEFPVAGRLRPGTNTLRVVFRSALGEAAARAGRLSHPLPYGAMEPPGTGPTHRNLIRKCQCQFGWDWGPIAVTAGLWQSIHLSCFDGLQIDYVRPLQFHEGERVEVRVAVHVDVARAGEYEVRASLAGVSAAVRAMLAPGKSMVAVPLVLERPALWWPRGQGPQILHDLRVEIAAGDRMAATRTVRLGLRRVELVQEEDEAGRSFFLRINGRPVFLKGFNWIPTDSYPPRMTRAVYTDLLRSAAEVHTNALRVWGGGLYERDEFYDLCDEQGFLVWQDFMFACAMYPSDDGFLANVAAEAAHQLRRLAHHPCLTLLCGNNENEWALGWFEETKANRDRYTAGYDRLYLGTLGRAAADERPDLPYWPSSPSNGPEEYGDPNATGRGDTHYWEVWHGGKRFSQYLTVTPRFSSEFGFQSVPSLETLRTVLEPGDLNISSPLMDHRQRSPIGNRAMVEHLMYEYRFPRDFAGFVYLSQVQQGLAMKTAVEHWRRCRPMTMGALIWQLNDIWPCNTWSSIEYGGRWKILHSMAKRFQAPLLLSLADRAERLEVWGTSDLPEETAGDFILETRDFAGVILRSWPGCYRLGPGESRALLAVTRDEAADGHAPEEVFLVLRAGDEGDGLFNWTFLAPAKRCAPPSAAVSLALQPHGAATAILLAADRPVFHVWLEATGRHGTYSDNAFLLLPDRPRTVVFTPRDGRGPLREGGISLRHLADV